MSRTNGAAARDGKGAAAGTEAGVDGYDCPAVEMTACGGRTAPVPPIDASYGAAATSGALREVRASAWRPSWARMGRPQDGLPGRTEHGLHARCRAGASRLEGCIRGAPACTYRTTKYTAS